MERFVRRTAVWLACIVMAAMALGGCKGKSKFADVKDEDFEKTGYYFGTKRRMSQYGYLQSVTDYYYVIKNNSDQKVAIIGNATIHGVNGDYPLWQYAFQGCVPGGAEAADVGGEYRHQCRIVRAFWG